MSKEKWLLAANRYREEERLKREADERRKNSEALTKRQEWLASPDGVVVQAAANELVEFMNGEEGAAATELLSAAKTYITVWQRSDDGGDSYWTLRFYGNYAKSIFETYDGQGVVSRHESKNAEPLEIIECGIKNGIKPENFLTFLRGELDKLTQVVNLERR